MPLKFNKVTGNEFEEATSTDKRATGSFKLPASKAQQKVSLILTHVTNRKSVFRVELHSPLTNLSGSSTRACEPSSSGIRQLANSSMFGTQT